MRKKILMMVGAFIAGGATVTGVRKFLKMIEREPGKNKKAEDRAFNG